LRNRAAGSSRQLDGLEAFGSVVRSFGSEGSGARWFASVGGVVLMLVTFFALASGANALNLQPFTETISPDASALTQQQRPYTGMFGSAAQPVTVWGTSITVERDTGDVLVLDFVEKTLSRFHADGTPAPFTALGTNIIDGKEANGKPCSEEPASCDKTPEDEINGDRQQIAVDESDGPTKGDIYLDQNALIDIFAPDGHYLGQLTQAGPRNFEEGSIGGVAIDTNGTVYVANGKNDISKFVPSANPVVNDDFVTNLVLPEQNGLKNLEIGSGPTAGSIFTAISEVGSLRPIAQINKETGQLEFEFGNGEENSEGYFSVDPQTHNIVTGSGAEYEVSGGSQPVKVGRFIPHNKNGVPFQGLAINGSGELLVTEGVEPGWISVYGEPAVVPTVAMEPASEVTGTRATLTGTVNPSGLPVTKCVFRYFETETGTEGEAPCEGSVPTDSSPHPVHVTITGLKPNGHTYKFRLVAFNANGQEETAYQTLTTATTVLTKPATALGLTMATLTGTVRSEGEAYSECFFEYGLSTSVGFEKTIPCDPAASAIPLDFVPHEVKAAVAGLQSGSTYRYRLVATNSLGTLKGEEVYFGTFGPPVIEEVHASGADQSSVTLEARINPSGFGTSYRFEWGPTTTYGNSAPAEFEPIGSGTEPILVKTTLTGLSAASAYHYRVVATSSQGTPQSPDHTAETLDSCGLPDGRCFEEVSRHEAGPVAIPGEANARVEMHYQAATGGEGGFAYPVEGGYPEATKGADVFYLGLRSPGGWESMQLSPPISALNERNDAVSVSSKIQFLSNNLGCGVAESTQPLTADPSMRLIRELGGSNLYRINPDGSYTGITNLPPENATGTEGISNYNVAGASQNCGVVLFETRFAYPGVVTKGSSSDDNRLYEWNQGTLRNAGLVPGPSGPVVVSAVAGGQASVLAVGESDTQNAVSENGSRVFFSAERKTSPDPAEIGAQAIFVREDGGVGRDVSLSQTATPDTGAQYQWATADGSRVFFTANAGLTAESNSAGTDLYEYDLETKKLTDRSITTAAGGAEVAGFLGASADGSQVYFASRNQLIPGSGNSRAQNVGTGDVRSGSYSIYGEKAGEISFVGTFNAQETQQVLIQDQGEWTSQVSPDGRYLLFQSSAHVTGYDSNGVLEAYLYDADGGSHGTICVSCRQDGLPSADNRYGSPEYKVLNRYGVVDELHPPRFLTMRDGEPQVFFASPDPLAPGAVAGQNNVYEWSHDQVYRLVSAEEGQQEHPFPAFFAVFGGASEDGSDVYLITPETLTWEDGDKRLSAYDARIGGGFPEPAAPPAPCNATTEGSCQGPGQAGTAVPGAATGTFSGPGSPELQPPKPQQKKTTKKKVKKKPKKKPKKKGKKKAGKQKSGKAKKQSKRQANGNRRAGK
jgi:Tol biopolymer transport system component